MARPPSKDRKAHKVDEAVKAAFEAKAAEPIPDHLIELVVELDEPEAPAKAG